MCVDICIFMIINMIRVDLEVLKDWMYEFVSYSIYLKYSFEIWIIILILF